MASFCAGYDTRHKLVYLIFAINGLTFLECATSQEKLPASSEAIKLHICLHWLETLKRLSHNEVNMSLIVRKPDFAYAKTKTQISCAITAQLISTFVFTTQIVQ